MDIHRLFPPPVPDLPHHQARVAGQLGYPAMWTQAALSSPINFNSFLGLRRRRPRFIFARSHFSELLPILLLSTIYSTYSASAVRCSTSIYRTVSFLPVSISRSSAAEEFCYFCLSLSPTPNTTSQSFLHPCLRLPPSRASHLLCALHDRSSLIMSYGTF